LPLLRGKLDPPAVVLGNHRLRPGDVRAKAPPNLRRRAPGETANKSAKISQT
jgi:hypothetical protein